MESQWKKINKLNLMMVVCLLAYHFQGGAIIAKASIMESNVDKVIFSTDNTESNWEENDHITGDENETLDKTGDDNNQEDLIIDNDKTSEVIEFVEEDVVDTELSTELEQNEEQNPEKIEFNQDAEINLASLSDAPRSVGSGLVQLWQVVPEGQNAEGKSTAEIMRELKCRPNHNIYPSGGKSEHQTYVNSCYVDDALYLGEDANYYYIYLSGYEGKVPKSQSHYFSLDLNNDGQKVSYEIQTVAYFIPGDDVATARSGLEPTEVLDVPYLDYSNQLLNKYDENTSRIAYRSSNNTVQSPSYYANENGTLIHYITNNVKVPDNYSKVIVGAAPAWMVEGAKYYSYDGVYFYNNWRNIRVNGQGAVNESTPFYNYYQYLSVRSRSNYNAQSIDNYTNNNVGTEGKLVNTGQYFYAVQDKYGINGALQYSMGIHESGWGKSSLSLNKNNLFGMNATDSNPYGNGTSFPTVEAGINYHADRYLSWGYTDPIDDARYFGAHVGNKGSGMNVKYASDPFWGEKIAGWYYKFDQSNGMQDFNYYKIGVKASNAVINVYSQSNTNSSVLYQTRNKKSNLKIANYPFLIVGEEGDFYKIQSDTPIVNGHPSYSSTYNWDNSKGYISKESLNYTNKNLDGWINDMGNWYYYQNGAKVTGWLDINGERYYFDNSGKMRTGWLQLGETWYYFNASGHMQSGFVQIGNYKYYFNHLGEMQKGWVQVGNYRYYFNESGEMQTGWLQLGETWYYLNGSGEMQTGWLQLGNKKYYLKPTGEMHNGWLQEGDKWYFFWDSGSMAKGWVQRPDGWYYLNSDGVMRTGWLEEKGKTYYLNGNGKMVSGWQYITNAWYFFWDSGGMVKGWIQRPEGWYYTNSSGHMQIGWQTIQGKRYYFYSSGLMATNTVINGHKIGPDGWVL